MESEARSAEPGLIDRLLAEPHRFSFFQLVQLVERDRAGAAPLGEAGPPAAEALRLRPALSMAFPKADVAAVERGSDGRLVVDVAFLGLYGSTSPLPNFYSEDLLQDDADDDEVVRGFLDVFHHRVLSLFYRAWVKYRHHVQYRAGATDPQSRRVLCLAGHGVLPPAPDALVGAPLVLRYAGLFAHRPGSGAAVRAALADYFPGVPVEVIPCAERWVAVAADALTRLGAANARLGTDVQVGERLFDRAGAYTIALGPLTLERFLAFLPGRRERAVLGELARMIVTDPLTHRLELKLPREEVPPLSLGGPLARLGWSTWLGRPEGDVSVVFA